MRSVMFLRYLTCISARDEVAFTNPQFAPEMVAYIRAKGKKVISWNPGWHYKPGEIDMTHLWSYRGKAQEGIPCPLISRLPLHESF